MFRAPRSFSTSARVHPSFLPHLRNTRRMPYRWIVPFAALSGAAFAAKAWLDRAAIIRSQDVERDHAERQRRNDALMDVYGDRSSLEALEQAVKHYEERGR